MPTPEACRLKAVLAQDLELSRLNGVELPSSELSDFVLPASFNVPDTRMPKVTAFNEQ